jgi:outer membrane lipoprotein-sorting protein
MLTSNGRTVRRRGEWLGLWLLIFLLGRPVYAQEAANAAPLTTTEVVERMVAMNQRRSEALRSYNVTRVYHVENTKFNRKADLVARMTYYWPDEKKFTVLSESGSGVLRKFVLRRAMESEQEAAKKDVRRITDIHPNNYDFRLMGSEQDGGRQLYVLEATPKVNNKFSFRGRIWVDAQDFAVVRVEGQPAKNPSWWLKRVDIRQSYQKLGDFWLPLKNESVSQVRIFGRSSFIIQYKDYQILDPPGAQP